MFKILVLDRKDWNRATVKIIYIISEYLISYNCEKKIFGNKEKMGINVQWTQFLNY